MAHMAAVVGVISVATSCFAFMDSETGRIIGVINTGGRTPVIEAPDTVRLGATFAAIINSFGNGCTTPDGVKLTLLPAEARVIPFDRMPTDDDVICTDVLAVLPHAVALHFTQPGTATIVADGMVHGTNFERARGTVTKAVTVVP